METPSTHHQYPQAACLVKAGLQSHVFTPRDPTYQASLDSYFSNTSKLGPACIFIPESAEQVSTAIKALVAAKEKFATRSGGHAPLRASNNIYNGVTIDLSHLNDIQYDAASNLVSFGPGVRWKHIYEELQKHSRVVAGGREGETGVAGFLLGGGNTWYTSQMGFACDNVVSYEVVLADGQIITAKQDTHTDLFRALKGGSNNFGIVVNFTMNTIPYQDIWGGTTMSSKEHVSDMIHVVADFTTNLPSHPDSSLIAAVNYIPQLKDVIVGGALVETRGIKDAPAFAKWSRLPKMMDTTKTLSILDMGLKTALPYNMYDTWFTLTIKNDVGIMSKAAEVHNVLVEDLKSYIPEGDFLTQCIFQPLPMSFAQHSVALGGNILGIERNGFDGLLFQLNTMVRTSDQNDFAYRKVKAGVEAVKGFAETIEGGLLDWVYLNYADQSQDPLGSYGAENVSFMKRVAASYDPNGVFQTLCPGGFKIPKTAI
ncbi:hypothetical protein F4779DRAFT_622547 [Xylariaceae sp. FL0662B]|nr:hypothetical protein F4779DRAFT_622547 [Xylariaceae sp. FL0662B]